MLFTEFLEESDYVDYSHPAVCAKAESLFCGLSDIEKIRAAYEFVRDEIPHTMDIHGHVFPAKASATLLCGSGICHAKANLLAALLRCTGIPAGFCFERITLADDDRHGYCVHGFNAVFFEGDWIFLDARGNNAAVHTEFSTDSFSAAYPPRSEYDEYFYDGIYAHPEPQVMELLNRTKSIAGLMKEFPDSVSREPEIKNVSFF